MYYLQRIRACLLKIWSCRRSALIVIIIAVTAYCSYRVVEFFNTYQLSFRSPIVFQNPVVLTFREIPVVYMVGQADRNVNPLTEDQQYLCNKFGNNCRVALAIFRAESGLNAKAIGVNKDGSVDLGCMQINSVHLKKLDTSHVNLLNCHDNIDVAYLLYKQQNNFNAWSAYKSGLYKKYLIN